MNYSRYSLQRSMRELNSRSEKRVRKVSLLLLQLFIIIFFAAIIIAVCAGIGAFRSVIDSAPSVGNIDVTPTGFSTFVYDSEGRQTAKLVSTDSNRIPVSWDMIPQDLCDAFVAIEDERFYTHHGIDIQGIIRAGITGIRTRNFSQGASTITQQLLKNNVFTDWTSETFTESVKRKIQEQYLAVELEKAMSKEDILLNYMNTINLGHNTLGVQAASLRYFGKSVSDLTLSECAVIAGITQNPSSYDPIVFPEDNEKRRKHVLDNMLRLQFITQDEYDRAMADNVYSRIQVVDTTTGDEVVNSYFVDALTNQVLADLMEAGYTETQAYTLLYSGGLNIYSTQDPRIQAICDEVTSNPDNYPPDTKWYLSYRLTLESSGGDLQNYSSEMLELWLKENGINSNLFFSSEEAARNAAESYKDAMMRAGDTVQGESITLTPQPQISITVIDQHTGEVLAMVGGRGQKTANRTFNRATDAMKQPGSTFKILSTYAPALDSAGLTLATTQLDAPYKYPDGTPVRNWYGESYRGICSLRTGIEWSLNVVTVKTLEAITPRLGMDYLKSFGFTTLAENEEINGQVFNDDRLPLALGGITHGVKNIEINAAYAAIANGGVYIAPKLYTKVTNHEGRIILDNTQRESHRVLKETTAWLLTSAMEDVVKSGTGTATNFGTTAIAGKTGTTEGYNDVWFCGYTDYYTASVWAGYDQDLKLSSAAEKALAQSIWRKCMEKIHEGLEYRDFAQPPGIVKKTICRSSGKLPVAGLCDGTLGQEFFAEDNIPEENCDVHFQGMICSYSGLPAADACPFATPGVVNLSPGRTGQRCEHTAAFMASEAAAAVVASQQNEINVRNASKELDSVRVQLVEAATALENAQQAFLSAQETGDVTAIENARAAMDFATDNYNAVASRYEALKEMVNSSEVQAVINTGGGE